MTSPRVLAAALGAIVSGLIASAGGDFLQRQGWVSYDFWQRANAPVRAEGVTFVVISQGSLDQLREDPESATSWPWPRGVYGAFVKVANEVGARAIVFDGLFANASVAGVEDDKAFGRSIKASKIPVVMGGDDGRNARPPNPAILQEAGDSLRQAVVTVPLEEDGVYRRMPLFIDGRPTLAFAALRSDSEVERRKGETLWLRFYRDHGIPWVEASDVFRIFRAIDDDKPIPGDLKEVVAQLKDTYWVVGASAPGLTDLKVIPTEANAPGPLVHATAIANWLSKTEVKILGARDVALSTSLFAFLFFLYLFFVVRPIPALFGGIAIASLGSFGLSWAAWLAGAWMNPLPILMSTSILGLGVLGYRFQREWKERERLAQSVENAMSSDMVAMIRRGELSLTRFGERREITILFSDLSGFTTLSEKLGAEQLVELLNLYLEEAVQLIFKKSGFVDKFIGDAVMALWGAPVIGQADHAKLALETALGFKDAVARFNEKAKEKFGETGTVFKARVGLHTGTAIVGNIGSQNRNNYTAIGDSVNLASRLEGIGKHYDCELLISKEALDAAGSTTAPGFIRVDVMAVKGRTTPTHIFTYVPDLAVTAAAAYENGFAAYQAGRFEEAIASFEQAMSIPSAGMMIKRCRTGLTPLGLPQLKNGVWHHDEK
ncbi:MAG: CHASE2 domain-containing protein [Bdellovibrionota bacterium]